MLFFLCLIVAALAATPTVPKRSPTILEKRGTSHATTGAIYSGIVGYNYKTETPVNVLSEASKIMDQWWDLLYDPKSKKFYNSNPKCNKDEPQAWALCVAFQSLLDGCRKLDNKYLDRVEILYDFMESYWNSDANAYAVTTTDSADMDNDDNAQILYALVDAYEITGKAKYKTRAQAIAKTLMTQWNETAGGVTWHYAGVYVAAISTSETAQGLLRLYELDPQDEYITFAEKCVQWLYETLWVNSTNLIKDGIGREKIATGTPLTYHVGTTMSACIGLYNKTENTYYKTLADKLAQASIHRSNDLFNTTYTYNLRWWTKNLSYSQLLFLGLKEYYQQISNDNSFFNELTREGRLAYDFARGSDGLYFKAVDPLVNSEKTYKLFKSVSGTDASMSLDSSQFCNSDTNSYSNRYMIYQASAAKIFFYLSEITKEI